MSFGFPGDDSTRLYSTIKAKVAVRATRRPDLDIYLPTIRAELQRRNLPATAIQSCIPAPYDMVTLDNFGDWLARKLDQLELAWRLGG